MSTSIPKNEICIPKCVLILLQISNNELFEFRLSNITVFVPTMFFIEINEGCRYSLNQGAAHHVSG